MVRVWRLVRVRAEVSIAGTSEYQGACEYATTRKEDTFGEQERALTERVQAKKYSRTRLRSSMRNIKLTPALRICVRLDSQLGCCWFESLYSMTLTRYVATTDDGVK